MSPRGSGGQHDPGGRGEGELEAGIGKVAGTESQDQEGGEGEAVENGRLAVEQCGSEHEHAHDDGAQDRRLWADDEREPSTATIAPDAATRRRSARS